MPQAKLQASRFEQKYFISEELALHIREFVQSYLELDENGVGKPNYSYPVHSLYLDSEDLNFYWCTMNGDKNRFRTRGVCSARRQFGALDHGSQRAGGT